MALIAKETLVEGFTTVALPGTLVSPEMVERNGWQDKVEDTGADIGGSDGDEEEPATPKRRSRKAQASE